MILNEAFLLLDQDLGPQSCMEPFKSHFSISPISQLFCQFFQLSAGRSMWTLPHRRPNTTNTSPSRSIHLDACMYTCLALHLQKALDKLHVCKRQAEIQFSSSCKHCCCVAAVPLFPSELQAFCSAVEKFLFHCNWKGQCFISVWILTFCDLCIIPALSYTLF